MKQGKKTITFWVLRNRLGDCALLDGALLIYDRKHHAETAILLGHVRQSFYPEQVRLVPLKPKKGKKP